jgi:uncharacterized protein DUF4062
VFVSSTLDELASERVAAKAGVSQLRLTPVLFESGAVSEGRSAGEAVTPFMVCLADSVIRTVIMPGHCHNTYPERYAPVRSTEDSARTFKRNHFVQYNLLLSA